MFRLLVIITTFCKIMKNFYKFCIEETPHIKATCGPQLEASVQHKAWSRNVILVEAKNKIVIVDTKIAERFETCVR